jgi:hypothetical protein
MATMTVTDAESGSTQGSMGVGGRLRLVPTDYDLIRTTPQIHGDVDTEAVNMPTSNHEAQESVSNPPSWPTDHRDVPPYRPVNRQLDRSTRSAENNVLALFITTMLSGCHILAV